MKLYPPSMLPSADGKPSDVIVCADYDNCIFGSGRAAERTAELEAALKALLDFDDERFGLEGEPSDVEKRCRDLLDKRQGRFNFQRRPA